MAITYTANVVTEELEDGSYSTSVRVRMNGLEVSFQCDDVGDALELRNALRSNAIRINYVKEYSE